MIEAGTGETGLAINGASKADSQGPRPLQYERDESIPGAGTFGMALFIAALSMLFGASMIGFMVIRLRADAWPPEGMPYLPRGLWFSTILLILCSSFIHRALQCVRRNDQSVFRISMVVTGLLGMAFLVCQSWNWWQFLRLEIAASTNLYAFTFYVLTGLHAIHVIGGLIPLGVVTQRAFAGRYSPEYHPGVLYCTMYWHFLDAVWMVMFLLMVVFA